MANEHPPNDPRRLRVGQVSAATGLSIDVIRVWERRYGAVIPQRTPQGARLYTEEQCSRLLCLAQLVAAGSAISTLAHLNDEQLFSLSGQSAAGAVENSKAKDWAAQTCRDFLNAVGDLELRRAEQIIQKASLLLSRMELFEQVVGPILAEVGERWAAGTYSVFHEHAATSALRDLLAKMGPQRAAPGRGKVVAATPPGERHELGALMAALIAASAGYEVLYVGADMPIEQIVGATESWRAEFLLLSIICLTDQAAREITAKIRAALDVRPLPIRDVRMILGGRSAPDLALPGLERVGSLSQLVERLESTRSEQASDK